MKVKMKMFAVVLMMVLAAFTVKAQNGNNDNPTIVNGNYKHQMPTSKGNTFKDSFKNDDLKDASVDNYKRQTRYRKTGKSAFRHNFDNIPERDTRSYKHPYGL